MTGNNVIATAPVTPARIRLFQPSQRPIWRKGEWISTSWGRCKVDGRLGQRHADLLEAILYCAERRQEEDAGTVRLLVDPSRVRRVMSDARYSPKQVWCLLRELRACTIEIETPDLRIMGGLIESAEYTKKETRHDPLSGGDRRLWTVRLGKAWAELMRRDMVMAYDPSPITRLEHGISQAVARFLLTQSISRQPNGGWKLDTLILVTTDEPSSQKMRDARRRLRADSAGLDRLGIEVSPDGRVKRRGTVARCHGTPA